MFFWNSWILHVCHTFDTEHFELSRIRDGSSLNMKSARRSTKTHSTVLCIHVDSQRVCTAQLDFTAYLYPYVVLPSDISAGKLTSVTATRTIVVITPHVENDKDWYWTLWQCSVSKEYETCLLTFKLSRTRHFQQLFNAHRL